MITLDAYKGEVVGVFGLGKTGLATVRALAAGGAKVVAWDDGASSREALEALNLDVKLHPVAKWPWEHFSMIVIGPGVPLNYPAPHEVVTLARQYCCPIVGDIELLYQAQPHATYVTITGTNGKSTTTALIGHLLKHAGNTVEVGGNIGVAALDLAPLGKGEVYVLELSSYQLDLLATTRFDIAVMLNISPDHIDRHGSLEGYIAAKQHIFDRQTAHDLAIIATDDAHTRRIAGELAEVSAAVVTVNTSGDAADVTVVDGVIDVPASDDKVAMNIAEIRQLKGRHNWQNAGAAYAVCQALDIDPAVILAGMESFSGLEHRMEWAGQCGGVTFVNDSKATNANAAAHALGAWDTIYWILGGVAKDGGIETLAPFFPKVARAYLIGEASEAFAETLGGEVRHSVCGSMERAVAKAYDDAKQAALPGSVILLSPACASFDQYPNFEMRGDDFKRLVKELAA